MPLEPEKPNYKPIAAVCNHCDMRVDVSASHRVWPYCPSCGEPMVRMQSGDDKEKYQKC